MSNKNGYGNIYKLGFMFIFLVLPLASLTLSIVTDTFIHSIQIPKKLLSEIEGTTSVLDNSGKVVKQISSDTARIQLPLKLNEMGPHLPTVTVALEDHRFNNHDGIDRKAIIGAAIRNFKHRNQLSGASTITQQTIKLATERTKRSIENKISEALLAMKLERIWSKKQILEAYFNQLDYGNRRLGPESAAQTYFGKNASDLTLGESIFLAGLPQSPTKFNPWLRWENAHKKYLRSINRLEELNIISNSISKRLIDYPPTVIKSTPPSIASDYVNLIPKEIIKSYKGKKLPTFLDLSLQEHADSILKKRLGILNRHLIDNAAMVVIDNSNGAVLAVSSVSRETQDAEEDYNAAFVWRHAGSTLKPFIYLLGIEDGSLNAASLLPDTQDAVPNKFHAYEPENFNRSFNGPTRLRNALACSLNIPAVYALSITGARAGFDYLTRFGFDTKETIDQLGAGFVLGNRKIRLIDIAAAYSNLSRSGIKLSPKFTQDQSSPPERIASKNAVDIITDILCDNDARSEAFGISSPLNISGHRVAVKTGTSSSFRDAWTVGYNRDYTVAVWFGNLSGKTMNGTVTTESAAPAWNEMMTHLIKKRHARPLELPNLKQRKIDSITGLLPSRHTKQTVNEFFTEETAPVKNSSSFYDKSGNLILDKTYTKWCLSNHNYLNAKVRKNISQKLNIISPSDGSIFIIDANIPEGQQTIPLLSDEEHSQWYLNGSPIKDDHFQLVPGIHTIEAAWNGKRGISKIKVK